MLLWLDLCLVLIMFNTLVKNTETTTKIKTLKITEIDRTP